MNPFLYAGVVAGRPVIGETTGVDSSAPLPTKYGASHENKGWRYKKASRGTPPCLKSPEEDVRVETTVGGHFVRSGAGGFMVAR